MNIDLWPTRLDLIQKDNTQDWADPVPYIRSYRELASTLVSVNCKSLFVPPEPATETVCLNAVLNPRDIGPATLWHKTVGDDEWLSAERLGPLKRSKKKYQQK